VNRKGWLLFAATSVIWGSSFLFIRVWRRGERNGSAPRWPGFSPRPTRGRRPAPPPAAGIQPGWGRASPPRPSWGWYWSRSLRRGGLDGSPLG